MSRPSPDLRETFDQLDELRRHERRVAMATLVSTKGTTPRKEGAKMWVGEDGRIRGSVTIGGCVDAQVLAESDAVLRSAAPALLSLSLGDEEAWDLGLTCGGAVDVLIEPVQLDDDADPVVEAYRVIRAEAEAGRRAVAVVPLGNAGATPSRRLVVREDGTTAGTLGDASLDAAATTQALDAIARSASRTIDIDAGGRRAALFFELHGPATTLVIFGAGQVAMPLARFAKALGWKTVLIDARDRYATRDRFPDADEIHIGALGEIAARMRYDASTIVVLVAHDYKFELPVLRAVLAQHPAYIGLLGNRRRGRALLDFLAADGFDAESLARVHVPVGLDIGARTAPEIALAALAEAIAVRNGRPGTALRARDPAPDQLPNG
ncbi:MAG TPA: XdhC family protein [Gemmatimonadaceae bacterium]|nr:XdhC family protein [Gemmatimonadaceae bacterium]